MGQLTLVTAQEKMSLKYLRRNLKFISHQSEDSTLITTDGQHIKTQRHLLSIASPYLAALISQTDHVDWIAISVPFSSKVVRKVLENLDSEDCNEIQNEGFDAAKELGIMFLNKAQTKWIESVKDERHTLDNDDAVSVEESSDFVSSDEIDDDKGNDKPQDELKVNAKKKKIKATVGTKDTKEHKCSTCDLEFKRYSHLSDHFKKLHPGVKHFLCETCGKGFSTDRARDHHIETVHSDNIPFFCDHCGKSFSTAGNKNIHIETVHSEGPGMQCPHCEKMVKHLSRHINQVHKNSGEKFTCEECGKIFGTKRTLSIHMRYHLPDEVKRVFMDKHRCKDCGEGFMNSTKLKRHEARHTGIKFHCQRCPKSYFRLDHLKTHVTNAHGM